MCGDRYTDTEARVICRQLGYQNLNGKNLMMKQNNSNDLHLFLPCRLSDTYSASGHWPRLLWANELCR